jgi:prepilin-type N-terminal cleavage/methylation domain-containing protein
MKEIKNTDGFTIIELLVSIVITVILVAGINAIYIAHLSSSQQTRSMSTVASYAENKIESLRSLGFLGLSDGSTDISNELPGDLKNPKSGTLIISSKETGLKEVKLNISYNDQGNTRDYSYTTYIGELGVGQY